jgi:hypothetical protein
MDNRPLYDVIGVGYSTTRREDPRIAQEVWDALGDASSVANIGAGSGIYAPRDREVIAVEPSAVMLAQRAANAAPAIRGAAEQIPLEDASVDASMAVFTDQHWDDCALGLSEMRRIARRRVVALTIDHRGGDQFWLIRDYLTEYSLLRPLRHVGLYELGIASNATIHPVPVPYDCTDGLFRAFWRRPHAYLDPVVRAGISVFHRLDSGHVERAMQRLAEDLASGLWTERNRRLLQLDEFDLGLRLIVWPK